jgi:hypothetical protein
MAAEIKAGQIAFIKITDEPVFVLSVKLLDGYHALAGTLSGVQATVRRPNVDEHGRITHSQEQFFVDELETKEDAELRKAGEIATLKAQFQAERAAIDPSKLVSTN